MPSNLAADALPGQYGLYARADTLELKTINFRADNPMRPPRQRARTDGFLPWVVERTYSPSRVNRFRSVAAKKTKGTRCGRGPWLGRPLPSKSVMASSPTSAHFKRMNCSMRWHDERLDAAGFADSAQRRTAYRFPPWQSTKASSSLSRIRMVCPLTSAQRSPALGASSRHDLNLGARSGDRSPDYGI